MIYCVVPEALADELFPKLESYYADDPHVTVIVDRRKSSRRETGSSGGGHARGARSPTPARHRRAARARERLSSADAQNVSKVVVHVDGGARGNPGPAAVGVVVSDPDGAVLDEFAETDRRGHQQRRRVPGAAARACERAAALGASEVEFVNDSELVAKQINGAYKVKHPAMKPLYEEAMRRAARRSSAGRIRSVPRAQNARADALVNEALDGLR